MMGRPKIYTDEFIEALRVKLEAYINDNIIPIIAEFAYINDLYGQRLYAFAEKNADFMDTMKKAISKKTAQLEKLSLENEINVPMSIFSLKQLGWSDKKEISVPEDVKLVVKFNEVIDED